MDTSDSESDIRSLKGAVTKSRTNIKTNSSNIGSMNDTIKGIDNSISSLDGRIKVLEETSDYAREINNLNDSIINPLSQINIITVPDYPNV
jgi:archaellum component FlaC